MQRQSDTEKAAAQKAAAEKLLQKKLLFGLVRRDLGLVVENGDSLTEFSISIE